MKSKLILIDGAYLPFEGVYSFFRITEEAAVEGIQSAFDGEFLDNRIRSLTAATTISSLCDREIVRGAIHYAEKGFQEVNVGDAALLCPHLSATRAERRRHGIVAEYVFVMSVDITSAQGLADKIVSAKPDGVLFTEWLDNIRRVSQAEFQHRMAKEESL